jgi:hypothetical protein
MKSIQSIEQITKHTNMSKLFIIVNTCINLYITFLACGLHHRRIAKGYDYAQTDCRMHATLQLVAIKEYVMDAIVYS